MTTREETRKQLDERKAILRARYGVAMNVFRVCCMAMMLLIVILLLGSEIFLGPIWLITVTKIAIGVVGLVGVIARIAEGEIEKKLDEIKKNY